MRDNHGWLLLGLASNERSGLANVRALGGVRLFILVGRLGHSSCRSRWDRIMRGARGRSGWGGVYLNSQNLPSDHS
jgi:hypothetical protein